MRGGERRDGRWVGGVLVTVGYGRVLFGGQGKIEGGGGGGGEMVDR